MKIDYVIKNKNFEFIKVLLKFNSLWQKILWVSIVVLNLVVLLSYNADNGDRINDPQLSSLSIIGTKSLMYFLGVFVGVLWVLVSFPIFLSNLWMTMFRFQHKKQLTRLNADVYLKSDETSRTKKFKYMMINIFKDVQRVLQELVDPVFWCLIICGVFIALGLALHPTYFSFLVIYLIVMSPSMNYLLTAIWEPKVQIISTILLLLLLVYMFVVIAYRAFWEYYPENVCYSLWNCFWISLDQTLKEQGLGKYLSPAYSEEEEEREVNLWRILFDNLEFLLISLLLIAIISGIIIDKFSELRQRKADMEKDEKTSCFICGKMRKEFDKNPNLITFQQHVKIEHNLWDYLYFIAYLKFQEEHRVTNMTAVESSVLKKLNEGDNSWFPCFALGSLEDSTLLPVVHKITEVETQLKAEMLATKTDIKVDIKTDIKAEISDVKAEISDVKADMKAETASILEKMTSLEELIRGINR